MKIWLSRFNRAKACYDREQISIEDAIELTDRRWIAESVAKLHHEGKLTDDDIKQLIKAKFVVIEG